MARRRREDPQNPSEGAPVDVQTSEPQIEVKMRGSADDVKKQLGVATEPKPEKSSGNGHDDEKQKFVDALRNSKYIIRVKRMTPREFGGHRTNVEVWTAELPLGYQEIQDEVSKEFGGGKYRIAVIDPNSNSTICADTFIVDGDPIVPELTNEDQAELDRVLMRGQPKSAAEQTEESLERRARVSAKLLEVEALESQLEDARKRRESGGKAPTQDNSRVDELERRVVEAKHQAELESRDRKHEQEMKELRELIAQNSRPKKDDGPSEVSMILAQMQKNQDAADRRFEALQKQLLDDKQTQVLEELRAIRNKPAKEQSSFLEMAEAMIKMKKLMGWDDGSDEDDDDADDPNDDRPWWEKALDRIGPKVAEKLVEKFTSIEEGGQKVDRETFLKEMSAYADQVATDSVRRALPAPRPAAAPAPAPILPPPPPAGAKPAPVTALPPPPPVEGAAPAPAPAAPAAPQTLTVEQEITLRVAGVLEMLEREMELRPNEYHWTYEGCWNSLPESILEKICAANDAASMINAFALPTINPEKLATIKKKIMENSRLAQWVGIGLAELKEWWAAKLQDAKFDPYADEDGEEGEEG
jgi:hypothetical protein